MKGSRDPGRGAVLVVDDDPLILRALVRSLADSFHVVAHADAEGAVEHVREGGVSVVVSDITMPGMSGVELLREIRAHDADLPVILITGTPTLETATEAIEYGVFRYLRKPFDQQVLRTTVEQALQLYRIARLKREALELHTSPGPSDRVGLEVTFRRALDSLWIAFQPIVSVSGRSVYGFEALMRSADPALPGPPQVLDAAERLDALPELGRLVRGRATAPVRGSDGNQLLFVNLHPRDLLDGELSDPESPLTAIAHRVVLEITERASLGGIEDIQSRIAALRALGFRIAVDDLGAGYAGLASFALLEPEIVKLDMILTRGIDENPVKQKLVASLTSLCREMGMVIVGEGVETVEERDTLVGLGCDLQQGYLFARPGPAFPDVQW